MGGCVTEQPDPLATALRATIPHEHWQAVGEAWADAALSEHSSVASFCRFVQELMALGAPAVLIEHALQSARDEVAHAQLSFSVATALLGTNVGPGPLPAQAPRTLSFAELVETTLNEACVDESLGAMAADEAARICAVPELITILQRIAVEEARHADLAWQTVGWAMSYDPSGVGDVLRAWLARLPANDAPPTTHVPDPQTNALMCYGVLGDDWMHAQRPMVEASIVRPVIEELLCRAGSPDGATAGALTTGRPALSLADAVPGQPPKT